MAACCGLLILIALPPSAFAGSREDFAKNRLERKIQTLKRQRNTARSQLQATRDALAIAEAARAAAITVRDAAIAERDAAQAAATAAIAERDEARQAIMGTLADQVRQVSLRGKLPEVFQLIFDPLRAAWPCTARTYQGEFSWSVDLETTDTNYATDPPTFTDCR